MEALQQVPTSALNSIMQDNLSALKKLLSQGLDSHGGWQYPNELAVSCLEVQRDEDVYMDSMIAQDFQSDKSVGITVSAILLVPGKALIAIVQLDQQETEEKVPSLTLLQNDFNRRGQIANFVRQACGRGPFASLV
mmetsp:Transcript_33045/g.40918  ORF Transcript_33045/g.40918 Transcript_33045/m.40918 type:complete len:136 (+) Transcript_33045:4050-4457(+)